MSNWPELCRESALIHHPAKSTGRGCGSCPSPVARRPSPPSSAASTAGCRPSWCSNSESATIFAARIAGNFVNDNIIDSMEFATELAGAKAIVVLGHTECGAIKGAVDNAKLGQLTGLLAKIRPSLEKLDYKEVPSSKNKILVQRVAEQNVKDATAMLMARSPVLTDRVEGRQTAHRGRHARHQHRQDHLAVGRRFRKKPTATSLDRCSWTGRLMCERGVRRSSPSPQPATTTPTHQA